LGSAEVAAALKALALVAGETADKRVTNTPSRLQAARTCYDHMAGQLAVLLHDRFLKLGWLSIEKEPQKTYELTEAGARSFAELGIDIGAARSLRRSFACACVDWSERRPHMGGALGAALLEIAFRKNWLARDLDSRALSATPAGRRNTLKRLAGARLLSRTRFKFSSASTLPAGRCRDPIPGG
jgi:hypothetical protein